MAIGRLKSFTLSLLLGLAAAQGSAEELSPNLIGGVIADPEDWPASPWVGNCSATIIGEQVLLTAAHCVSNGGTKSFSLSGKRYSGRCTHHPSYKNNNTADWALCALTEPVTNVRFEVIASAEEVGCSAGKEFLWTGFGCRKWGGGSDGKFRVGKVKAIRCPSGSSNDVITRGSVALCSGDSGGGGYVEIDGLRRVVGVNSRSNTTDTSYVSNTYSSTFKNWAKSWSESRKFKICGIHPDAEGCSL